jgi:predicted transcriptional regulator
VWQCGSGSVINSGSVAVWQWHWRSGSGTKSGTNSGSGCGINSGCGTNSGSGSGSGSVAVAVAQSFSAQVIKKINFFKTTTHVFYIKNAFFLRLILIFRPFFAHFFTDLELFFAIL